MRDLFHDDEDEMVYEPGEQERCTPERLLEFVGRIKRLHGRSPTLHECKAEFGGIIGPLVDYWELKRRGLA